ncbi:MAG: YebC/PmpR family DNA-binding transcriptional regulator [Syntrophomonadaceae bacterium]|nr:YebC/PmpR family DNA-binding transcriptional regulator [Syntrophomonadaceae bacterium]
MSGHSKWANIKHKKARTDEKKGKIFTKVAKEIIIAAREGGGDPEGNARLKAVIQKAKSVNMPNENIVRAIKRGTGEIGGSNIEEFAYEGYGPGGVALMVAIMTDNRNRTAADIRHLFSKYGGNMGEAGCVSWMFKKKGLMTVSREELAMDAEDFMLLAIEAGAEDVREDSGVLEVITAPEDFEAVKENLEKEGIRFDSAELSMVPENSVEVNDAETARKVLKLVDILEDHDDVQEVYANFSIPDDIMEKVQL